MVDLGTYVFKDLNADKLHIKNCLPILMLKNYMN